MLVNKIKLMDVADCIHLARTNTDDPEMVADALESAYNKLEKIFEDDQK